VADGCVGVAVVLLALQRTGSPAAAGLVVSAYTLPALVSGPVLGAWLDRTHHRKLALTTNQLILAASMAALTLTMGRVPLGWCLLIAAAAGGTLPLTSAGFTSLVPSLVPPTVLPRANTIDAITFNGAAIAGPAVAGSIAAAASADAAVWVTAVIALAAVPATLMLRMPAHHGQHAATSLWATIVAGTRVMLRTPPLRGGTLTTAVMQGAMGMLAVGFPLYAVQLGSTAEAGGALWAALEIGGLVGALAATRILARVSPERVIYVLSALVGLAIVTWPLARSISGAAVLVGVAGLISGPVLVATFSMRQRHSPHNLLAQITTAGASVKIGAYSLGAAAGGWLVPAVGALPALAVVGGLHLAGAAAGYLAGRPAPVALDQLEVGKSAP
jgi:MFS family permease